MPRFSFANLASDPGRVARSPGPVVYAKPGLRLVLPSPNGSALTYGAREAGAKRVIVGCLRNAAAVAQALADEQTIALVAAVERWGGAIGPGFADDVELAIQADVSRVVPELSGRQLIDATAGRDPRTVGVMFSVRLATCCLWS